MADGIIESKASGLAIDESRPGRCGLRSWHVLLIALAAAAIHIAVNGYAFGGCTIKPLVTSLSSDHANILPWVYWYQDPSLFPHDLQIQTGASYATVLWRLLGWLGKFIPVAHVFFGCHVAALVGTYAALIKLASLLADTAWAGVAACALFVVARDAPAGEATHDPALYTRMVALPLVLASVYGALRSRPILTFGAFLAAVAVHLLTAFYASPIITGLWLWSTGISLCRRLAWLLGVLGATIAIAVLLSGGAGISLGTPGIEWLNLQRGNNAMHLFPSQWRASVWRDALIASALLVFPMIGWAVHSQRRLSSVALMSTGLFALTGWVIASGTIAGQSARALRRFSIIVLVSCGLLGLMGWYFAEMRPSMLLMQLQPLRGIKLGMILACVAGAAWLCRSRFPIHWATTACCVTAWIGRFDALFLILLAVDGLTRIAFSRKTTFVSRNIGRGVVIAACCIAAGLLVRSTLETVKHPDGKAAYRYRPSLEFPWRSTDSPWVEVQSWVAGNTPNEASFITPPILEGFRTHARRSQFADWKQGTLSIFNEKFGLAWRDRLARIAGRSGDSRPHFDLYKSYNGLSAPEFRALAGAYGLTHAVTMNPVAGMTPVFSNRVFWVYPLR